MLILLITSGPKARGQKPMATSVAETDKICRKCHEQIYDHYLKTYMANGSGLAKDLLKTGEFHHAASGIDYSIGTGQDGPRLSYRGERSRANGGSISGSERLDYFLGSGHLGTTYLYSKNGYLFESPIAYYNSLQGYAMKPGLETEKHLPSGLVLNDNCLRCHMSDAQLPDAGTENHFSGLPFLHTGVTCESCHGDASEHVSSGGKAKLVNPVKLAPIKRDSVCITCHLEGDTSVERKGRSMIDYKPGDDIRNFKAYFVYSGAANTKRAVSEIEQFSASRCKKITGDSMSCMTCHEMHSPPSDAERVAYYRGKCLSCHIGEPFATKHHAENPDCTNCHMPKTGSTNIAHVAWTDHRIRRTPDPVSNQEPELGSGTEVVSILDGSGSRELGLAYYDLVTKGDASRKTIAIRLLSEARKSDPADVSVLRALGVLQQMAGNSAEAEQAYQAVLLVEPGNVTARTNLGTLLATRGKLQEAESLWIAVFNRNEDQAALGRNLAVVQCYLGKPADAEQTLRRALIYNPDLPELRDTLLAIESDSKKCVAQAATSGH
jgi:hypothetical protein